MNELMNLFQKGFKIVLHMAPFQNKVAEIRVDIWVGSFQTHVPPPPPPTHTHWKSVCGAARIGAPDDLSDVNTNFENFQNISNYLLPFFLPL